MIDGRGKFLDGIRPVVTYADVALDESGPEPQLRITLPEADPVLWPFSSLRSVPDQASRTELVLAKAGDPVSRLILQKGELTNILVKRCKKLRHRPPVKGRGRLAAWALGAVASVAIIITVLVPLMADQLAEYLPVRGEQALGETTFEQIREALSDTGFVPLRICNAPLGVAALETMKSRLGDDLDLPYPLTVTVLDNEMVNAFALPGGQIVFFRGLIDAANSADEVAAVFAHEIGHVVNRDPTRIALRSAGSIGVLGLLLGDFAGGAVVLLLAEQIIQASYTRKAEAAADVFAHNLLARSGIPPSNIASLFETIQDSDGAPSGLVKHLSSHPEMGDRIDAARQADALLTGALRPSLSEAEWQALQRICGRR